MTFYRCMYRSYHTLIFPYHVIFMSSYKYVYIHLWNHLETLPNCLGIQMCASRRSQLRRNSRKEKDGTKLFPSGLSKKRDIGKPRLYITFYRHNVRQSNSRNKFDGKQNRNSRYEIFFSLSIKDLFLLAVVNRAQQSSFGESLKRWV